MKLQKYAYFQLYLIPSSQITFQGYAVIQSPTSDNPLNAIQTYSLIESVNKVPSARELFFRSRSFCPSRDFVLNTSSRMSTSLSKYEISTLRTLD